MHNNRHHPHHHHNIQHPKYFDGEVPKGFMTLYAGRIIMFIAGGLLGLFLPIFIYEIFHGDVKAVFLFYGVTSIAYLVLIAAGIYLLDRLSFKRAVQFGPILLAAFYVVMYFIERTSSVEMLQILFIAAMVIITCFRVVFWVPYNTELAMLTDKKNRGRQMSSVMAGQMVLGAILPLVSAFIISRFGYQTIFILAILLYLVTMIPFGKLPQQKGHYNWTYNQTWNIFLHNLRTKKVMWAYVANGMETFVGFFIWPIFIYELLDGDLMQVGLLSTLIVAVSVVLQLTVGKVIDKKFDKQNMLRWGSIFYSIGWLIKIFIFSALHVFTAGVYHGLTQIFLRTPFNSLLFDLSSDEGNYLDEYTVIYHMAVFLGRGIMAVAAIIMSIYLPIEWTFLIAAVTTLALNFISQNDMSFSHAVKEEN